MSGIGDNDVSNQDLRRPEVLFREMTDAVPAGRRSPEAVCDGALEETRCDDPVFRNPPELLFERLGQSGSKIDSIQIAGNGERNDRNSRCAVFPGRSAHQSPPTNDASEDDGNHRRPDERELHPPAPLRSLNRIQPFFDRGRAAVAVQRERTTWELFWGLVAA